MSLFQRVLISGVMLTGLVASAMANSGIVNPDARTPSYYGSFGEGRVGEQILVVRDYLPWNGDVVPYLTNAGAIVTVISTADIAGTDLSQFCLVFLEAGTSEPGDATETNINAAVPQLETYLSGGGDVMFYTGTWGAIYNFPGSGNTVYDYQAENWFCNVNHPIAAGVPNPFPGNFASHDYFVGLPGNASCIMTDPVGNWTGAEYNYGQGHVVLMSQPVEFYLLTGYGYGQGPHFENLLINSTFYATRCDDGFVEANEQAQSFGLLGNYPNPFNPSTTISFSIDETSPVSLRVFDITGREVATLVEGLVEQGLHEASFDAGNMASGAYFYTLESEGQVDTRKMLLVK